MRIDFRDPNIPFSAPPPSPTTSPDISPPNIPIFHGKGVKDLYLLLREHQARQTRQNSGGGGGGCRGPAKIRQRGGCNNFYFLRDKNITF